MRLLWEQEVAGSNPAVPTTLPVNIIDKNICLCLNSIWQPINTKTVGEAISDLFSGPYKALNISYPQNQSGEFDFENPNDMTPLDWGEWVKLDVREYDLYVRSS